MSLLTKVLRAAFYSFCLTLWLMTTSEVFRDPIGKPSVTEFRDSSDQVKREDSTLYFKKLAGTNWTLYDIRFGEISPRKQIVGIPGKLNLPEGAEVEVDLMEHDMEEESKGVLGNKHTSLGNFGRQNRSRGNHVLVYNRVPKCASETMLSIIRKLSMKNRFRYRNSRVYWKQVLTPSEESSLVAALERDSSSVLFDRHFYIFDSLLLMEESAVNFDWVNMVREPVARLVSQFHYLRSARRWSKRSRKPPSEWFLKSLDRCVDENDPECLVGSGGQDLQLTYFCGSKMECGDPQSKATLQMAMLNLEKRFAVVGVMEHFDTSIAMMEAILPRWFRGARQAAGSGDSSRKNENQHPAPSLRTVEILRERLANDITFYNFAVQRLKIQNRTFLNI